MRVDCEKLTRFTVAALLIIFLFSSPTMAEEPMYAFSLDGQFRPITGCLDINNHSLNAVIISMNCKKSITPHIFLCSQGRMVQYYSSSKECQEAHDELKALFGEHTLATDPYEK